jgi:hypothetical protein
MSEDVTKLPKWAQQRITTLQANEEYWRRKALEAASAGDGTNTTIYNYHRDGEEVLGLPNNTTIRFKVGKARINVRVDGDKLDVRSDGDPLLVKPWACNAVTVTTEKR